jgi:WD40 repeat protein/DNA-binding SARP family transcriptional activator
MQIRVLGPLEASVDDRPVPLGGAKQRAVLAMLGLEANHAVTADRLIEGLWGEHPPASAAKMVQNYVWRLRRVLNGDGGAEILTRGRAYELRIDRERIDVCRLERLVAEAVRASDAGEPNGAAREALALFRGDPLADVADEPFADPEIRRLEELRLQAAELAIEADLAAGRHQELIGEIEALLAEDPLRERVHAQRMLALYRCGRQADALEAYRQARTTLVEEIGIEPGAELRRLHDAILRQDPDLDVEPAAAELPRELDASASPPLIGRDSELRRLRACWQRAAAGSGALVTLVGAYGMGKSRVAAEIAGEAHREGATVLYVAGTGPPEAALAGLSRARVMQRRTLVVVDDADRAPAEVRAELRSLAAALGHAPALVLATGQEAAALARLDPVEALALEPLDAESVHAIAGFYAPAGEADAIPVEMLLATSRGVARGVHEAASEWARRAATLRVDEMADRAGAGRIEARALVAELAGSVVELQSAREREERVAADGGPGTGAPVVCPYKGLATFEPDDAEYFFGRERLVADLVARLVGTSLLAVVGPSGSGKSSVVRAGLLPALAGGVLPGSEQWTQALIRPGEQPLRELRRATRRLDREWRSVLVVDQFEELFTACEDEQERAEFVAGLVRAARERTVVVLAVRGDLYVRCAAYPELSALLGANHVLVGPMARDELRRAIERPAQRVGLNVEPELVDALLADVDGQPGALPLLSTALLELWRERDGRRLRLAAYARSGGVQGAVARLAEEAYTGLAPGRQAAARKLLLRLTDEGEDGAILRRRIPLAELDADPGSEIAEVVAELTDRRLLTVSDGALEVAHEALLREWPRLRTWLEEDVEGRRLHRRLNAAASAWDADAREPGGLYRGARLASALDWAAGHEPDLSPVERAFLDESRLASGRAQRRLRLVLAGVASLLVVAVIAGLLALDQRGNARAEATAAAAQGLGAQALAGSDLDRSLLLARQGVALDDTLQTQGNLLATLLKSPAAIGVLRGDGDRLTSLDVSPDGRTLAFIQADGTLSWIDTRTRALLARQLVPQHLGSTEDVRFSDDGSRLAVGGGEPLIFDPRTRRIVTRLPMAPISNLRFSPDGRTLFAVLDDFSGRMFAQRYDARSGRPLVEPQFIARDARVNLMVTSDGGRVITSVDGGATMIRDARTLRPLRRVADGAEVAALSPDDRMLLLGGLDGSVRLVDVATGRSRTAVARHVGPVSAAGFSADGRTVVTAGEDRRAIVWDVAHTAARETLEGHSGLIKGVAISRDGSTLYTAALDGKVIVWDLAGDRRLGRRFDIPLGQPPPPGDFAPIVSHALSPDGRVLAVGHRDGKVTLLDPRTLRKRARFHAVPDGPALGMGFLPGGRLLAVGGEDGFLAVIDPRSGAVVRRLTGRWSEPVRMPSFSADGRLMATNSADEVRVWTLRDGRPTDEAATTSAYSDPTVTAGAALSPDGRTLAIASEYSVEILDARTTRQLVTLPHQASAVQFTPDGRYLAVGRGQGATQLYVTDGWRPVSRTLAGHTAEVLSIAVSPDSRILASGSWDGTVRLFDIATRQPLGAPLLAVPNHNVEPRFTPDGAFLFGFTDAGQAFRWDVRPASWARHACAVAGRTLTRPEWNDLLPGREYAPACGG